MHLLWSFRIWKILVAVTLTEPQKPQRVVLQQLSISTTEEKFVNILFHS